jgi:hypothetical protein
MIAHQPKQLLSGFLGSAAIVKRVFIKYVWY